jgi:hypothetical protein
MGTRTRVECVLCSKREKQSNHVIAGKLVEIFLLARGEEKFERFLVTQVRLVFFALVSALDESECFSGNHLPVSRRCRNHTRRNGNPCTGRQLGFKHLTLSIRFEHIRPGRNAPALATLAAA